MSEGELQFPIGRSGVRQSLREHIPVTIIPTAMTPEMLDQIRAVFKEELAAAKKPIERTPEDAFLRHILRNELSLRYITLPQYRAEIAKLDKQKAVPLSTLATSNDEPAKVVSAVLQGGDPEDLDAQGYSPLCCDVQYSGNVYRGVLYYIKDVE